MTPCIHRDGSTVTVWCSPDVLREVVAVAQHHIPGAITAVSLDGAHATIRVPRDRRTTAAQQSAGEELFAWGLASMLVVIGRVISGGRHG